MLSESEKSFVATVLFMLYCNYQKRVANDAMGKSAFTSETRG